jgi:shikimate dehydrogenase
MLDIGNRWSGQSGGICLKNQIHCTYVSRRRSQNNITYEQLTHLWKKLLIINTTPVGMYPKVKEILPLPFSDYQHFV